MKGHPWIQLRQLKPCHNIQYVPMVAEDDREREIPMIVLVHPVMISCYLVEISNAIPS
jgi:hypothetical protein